MIKKISMITIALFSFLWIIKEIVLPLSIAVSYSNKYMKLAHECDTAMEANWYNSQNMPNKKSDTIQMLACHEYDKVRKILLMSGLPESYASWLGLKSLDLYQRPAEEYVKMHRFKEK